MVDRVHHLGGAGKVSTQGMKEVRTAADTILGDVKNLAFGREIIYAKVGATALCAGYTCQAPAIVANHQNRPPSVTASIGEKSVTITIGATSAAADDYKHGWFVVTCGTGTTHMYLIEGHKAWAASITAATVNLCDGLEAALNTASLCTLVKNKCNGVVPTGDCAALTGTIVGVALQSAAAGRYVWLGKKGEFGAKVIGGTTIGVQVFNTTACTTGTLGPTTTATDTSYLYVPVGVCRQTAAAAALAIVDFKL